MELNGDSRYPKVNIIGSCEDEEQHAVPARQNNKLAMGYLVFYPEGG